MTSDILAVAAGCRLSHNFMHEDNHVIQTNLTKAEWNAIREIDDLANRSDNYIDALDFDKALLKTLETQSLVSLMINPDARLMVRTTGKGRRLIRPDDFAPTQVAAEMDQHEAVIEPDKTEAISEDKPANICKEDGCNEPCAVARSGKPHPRCQEHQRQFWRERNRQYHQTGSRDADSSRTTDKTAVITPPPVKPVNKVTKPAPKAPESVVEEAAPPPMAAAQPVADARGPRPTIVSGRECDGCVAAELLAIVRVMYPEIDETVDILTKAREIRAKLGL